MSYTPSSAKRRLARGKRRTEGFAVPAPFLPAELRQVNLNAAGIDIGDGVHFVAIPEGRDAQSVRAFGSFTDDLEALADWLEHCRIDTVAMEATGVYWIPLFELLERRGFEVKLVEPSRLKNVPGRKTDVLDCQWIQQLHTFGLLRGSFRPEDQICELRSYMRQRETLVKLAGQHVQHMQKALVQMNVKLTNVISDITGLTGLCIIDAILAGQHDPEQLAKLRDERCKNDEATIARALQGNWREDHLFALQQAVELYRFSHQKLRELDTQIEAHLEKFAPRSEGRPLEARRRHSRGRNEPRFDMRKYVYQMTGQDLTSIDGLDGYSALQLISEIGWDMSAWPTEKHFASWLCLCPGVNKTGGRRESKSGKTRRSSSRAATVLRMAAQSLLRVDCALGAFARRLRARLGAPKAITATAHKLAKIVYNLLKHGKQYVDRGTAYYEQQYRDQVLRNLRRRARQLGFQLVPEPLPVG